MKEWKFTKAEIADLREWLEALVRREGMAGAYMDPRWVRGIEPPLAK